MAQRDRPDLVRLRGRLNLFRGADTIAAGGILAVATALMLPIRGNLNVLNVSLIYLILVVSISLFSDRWTSIASAVAAFIVFNFCFIPPFYTLSVERLSHLFALAVFLAVAAVTSQLVYRVRVRTVEALDHGRRMELLFDLSHDLVADVSVESILQTILDKVGEVFAIDSCIVLLADDAGNLTPYSRSGFFQHGLDATHDALIGAVSAGRRVASQAVEGYPEREAIYVPIATAGRSHGVIGVVSRRQGQSSGDAQQLLLTFANQAALALERARLTEEETRAAVLARSDALKSALLSAVSHDLRTPLASIKASATSLLQEGVRWDPDDEHDLLIAIDEETDRLTRIVSNLLDLTRIEAGVLQPQKEWNDLGELIEETVRRARATIDEHEIEYSLVELPPMLLDYVEISQVLMNLIENAARYSPRGAPIEIMGKPREEWVDIIVADRGVGIPAGEEERIFEKFYRASNNRTSSGTGVGLSIARGITEAHGGTVHAERRAGGGTCFRVSLPVERAEAMQWARES